MKKKPSILMICINFSPELTGIGRYTGDMAKWLSSEGADLQVVTGFPYYPGWKIMDGYRPGWFRHESISDIPVLRCPLYVPKKPSAFRRILQDLSFFFSSWLAVTFLLLKGKRFDHVWVAMPSFLSALVGQWYCLWRPKSRLHIHVFDLQIDAAGSLGMIRNRWLLKGLIVLEGMALRSAHRVSCLTEGMIARLKNKAVNPSRICLLPIWVDTDRFRPTDPDLELLARLGMTADKKIILYSGAIGEKQGLERIPEMAVTASEMNLDLLFVIAGEGPYMTSLQQRASAASLINLKFIPLQPDHLFPGLLNSAWLHLILQKDADSENFLPSKLMPVLSVGGLALVTAGKQTSLGSMISENQIGCLSAGNAPIEILRQIEELLIHPEKVRLLKSNARTFVLDRFSQNKLLKAYWKEYLSKNKQRAKF